MPHRLQAAPTSGIGRREIGPTRGPLAWVCENRARHDRSKENGVAVAVDGFAFGETAARNETPGTEMRRDGTGVHALVPGMGRAQAQPAK